MNLPVMLSAFHGWAYFYTFSRSRGESWGSLWLALNDMGHPIPAGDLNAIVTLSLLALFAGIAFIALSAPVRPRLPQLAFLTVAAFLLVNKVYSPQYVLWLVFLFPLARPRWRDFIVWTTFETLYFIAIWWHLEGLQRPDLLIPTWPHTIATLARMGALIWVCAPDRPGHLQPGLRPRPPRRLRRPSRRRPRRTHVRTRRSCPTSDPARRCLVGLRRAGRTCSSADLVEGRGREADLAVDLVADGDLDVVGDEQQRDLHVRRLGEPALLAADVERRERTSGGLEATLARRPSRGR